MNSSHVTIDCNIAIFGCVSRQCNNIIETNFSGKYSSVTVKSITREIRHHLNEIYAVVERLRVEVMNADDFQKLLESEVYQDFFGNYEVVREGLEVALKKYDSISNYLDELAETIRRILYLVLTQRQFPTEDEQEEYRETYQTSFEELNQVMSVENKDFPHVYWLDIYSKEMNHVDFYTGDYQLNEIITSFCQNVSSHQIKRESLLEPEDV